MEDKAAKSLGEDTEDSSEDSEDKAAQSMGEDIEDSSEASEESI